MALLPFYSAAAAILSIYHFDWLVFSPKRFDQKLYEIFEAAKPKSTNKVLNSPTVLRNTEVTSNVYRHRNTISLTYSLCCLFHRSASDHYPGSHNRADSGLDTFYRFLYHSLQLVCSLHCCREQISTNLESARRRC